MESKYLFFDNEELEFTRVPCPYCEEGYYLSKFNSHLDKITDPVGETIDCCCPYCCDHFTITLGQLNCGEYEIEKVNGIGNYWGNKK